jgi:hypothetical protein
LHPSVPASIGAQIMSKTSLDRWPADAPVRGSLFRSRRALSLGAGLLATLALGVSVLPFGAAAAYGTARIVATPDQAAAGATIAITGSRFRSLTSVQLEWNHVTTGMPKVMTDDSGRFTTTIKIPATEPGSHVVGAGGTARGGQPTYTTDGVTVVSATASVAPTTAPTAQPTTQPTAPPPTTQPTAPPTAPPASAPPSTGIPPVPAANLLRKSFTDGVLAPFRAVTYPNDHPADAMSYACNYATDSSVVSVHDGYLDLRANRRSDNRWNCAFLSTGMDGRGNGATFSFNTGYVQFAARMNVGYATWQAPIWLLNTVTGWHSAEIDIAEVINGKLTYNLHGTVNTQVASTNPPTDLATRWHVFGVAKASDHITFTMDNQVIGRWNGSMPDPMALLADSKVGFQWSNTYPNSSTPSPSWVNLAWVTVSSTIPAGF